MSFFSFPRRVSLAERLDELPQLDAAAPPLFALIEASFILVPHRGLFFRLGRGDVLLLPDRLPALSRLEHDGSSRLQQRVVDDDECVRCVGSRTHRANT